MGYINFLIKPASSLCGLRCLYCFYEDEASHRTQHSMGFMTEETVQTLIREGYNLAGPNGSVHFAFQGGEPTLVGLPFFRKFVATAKECKPAGLRVTFSIQTNGMALDKEWAEFLSAEDFLVGLSIDGHKDLHNAYRVDASGNGTWNAVRKAAELLQRQGVKVNALCVVTAQCARSAQKVYQGLKKLGFNYMQFIACLDPLSETRGQHKWSLSPTAYGNFLCCLFDLWYQDWEQGDYHSIRLFDDYIHLLLGEPGSTCATCGQCGGYFVVEGDGSVYPCDFYVLDRWKAGRLGDSSLADIGAGAVFQSFLAWGQEKPAECAVCPWRRLCNGGCKNDWVQTDDGPHNYYCESFHTLFNHAGERMLHIAQAEIQLRRKLDRIIR